MSPNIPIPKLGGNCGIVFKKLVNPNSSISGIASICGKTMKKTRSHKIYDMVISLGERGPLGWDT